MPPVKKSEIQLFNIEKFSIAQLPELQGKKEEISSVIEANPIVVIIDSETYEQAKKSRTAVRTLRTGIEKEQKDVKKKFKEIIIDAVDKEYDSLVSNIKIEETLRQDSVTEYEEKKEAERKEKAEKEQRRVDAIKATIDNFTSEWKTAFNLMVFDTIESVGADFLESYTSFDLTVLEEFESLFPSVVEDLTQCLSEKTVSLTEIENARLEKERLQKEAKEANYREDLQSKRLTELLPFNRFGADVDMVTLWSLSEHEYKTVFDKKKELFTLDNERKIEEKRQSDLAEAKAKKEREDFEKEKAEFAKQQALQAKKETFEKRKQILIDLGFEYNANAEYNFSLKDVWSCFHEQIEDCDDILFEEYLIDIKEAIAKKSTPSTKIVHGIEIEEKAIEAIHNIETPVVSVPEETTVNICTSLPQDALEIENTKVSAPDTWEDIIEDFKNSGKKSYSKFLIENYNAPTKKQQNE